jgi:hypothetical protein
MGEAYMDSKGCFVMSSALFDVLFLTTFNQSLWYLFSRLRPVIAADPKGEYKKIGDDCNSPSSHRPR